MLSALIGNFDDKVACFSRIVSHPIAKSHVKPWSVREHDATWLRLFLPFGGGHGPFGLILAAPLARSLTNAQQRCSETLRKLLINNNNNNNWTDTTITLTSPQEGTTTLQSGFEIFRSFLRQLKSACQFSVFGYFFLWLKKALWSNRRNFFRSFKNKIGLWPKKKQTTKDHFADGKTETSEK